MVLTGAGISAESGLKTFRDANGLWEGHDVMEVASIEGWYRDQQLVLDFYNQRRKQAQHANPNPGHLALVDLERDHEVVVITQNVDNLHEKAGSTNIIHLHGQLFQSRSTGNPTLIYEMDDWKLGLGDLCEEGFQLRPNIVWFGEEVPAMEQAIEEVAQANYLLIVGTSMVVYPAAGLINFVRDDIPIFVVDPSKPQVSRVENVHYYQEPASTGVSRAIDQIRKKSRFIR